MPRYGRLAVPKYRITKGKVRAIPPTPAVLRYDHVGWVHVTHPDNVASIREHGLLVNPPKRVYGSSDPFATIGGLYVAPMAHLDNLIDRYCEMWGRAAVFHVKLLAGTRFCLDEDVIDEFGYVDDEALRAYANGFNAPTRVLDQAFEETRKKSGGEYLRNRVALDHWSCRLAQMLNQDELDAFALRLFDPPQILDLQVERCRG